VSGATIAFVTFFQFIRTLNKQLKQVLMKKYFVFVVLLFAVSFVKAQSVYSVDYASRADVKVFVVDYASQADLKVFKVSYQSQAGKNNGLWFFVEYESRADKKIYFVDYASQADVKIFFVDYQSQAGWVNKSKMAMFY
jgi:hypothetical protein